MNFIKNYNELATTPQRKIVMDLIEAGISSIQPEKVLENFSVPNIENYERVFLIGFGKGSARISKIVEQKLGDKLTEGYVIDVDTQGLNPARGLTPKVQFTQGTHPLPSQTNIDFTSRVIKKLSNLDIKDLVIVVVTGGGSALFELPVEGLTLDDIIRKNEELLKSGKKIAEMNEERKKLSLVKGGGLARILKPAKILGLIFSDVPGNDIPVVASGPTDDPSAENILMLSNKTALDAMKKKSMDIGINTIEYGDQLQGEAREVGIELIKNTASNSILLAGGETTVKVQNKSGKGGRNQELVLGALLNNQLSNYLTIAAIDSDGWDNTEFAGAIGDLGTLEKAKKMNLDPQKFLNENNSFEFFQKVGDGIITGRLPSNVADLMVVLWREENY